MGDLAGPSALGAIATEMASAGQSLAAFYASNVERYLYENGRFEKFVANLARLPRTDESVIIRSVFGNFLASPRGYRSVSRVQQVKELVNGYAAGRFGNYAQLVGRY